MRLEGGTNKEKPVEGLCPVTCVQCDRLLKYSRETTSSFDTSDRHHWSCVIYRFFIHNLIRHSCLESPRYLDLLISSWYKYQTFRSLLYFSHHLTPLYVSLPWIISVKRLLRLVTERKVVRYLLSKIFRNGSTVTYSVLFCLKHCIWLDLDKTI